MATSYPGSTTAKYKIRTQDVVSDLWFPPTTKPVSRWTTLLTNQHPALHQSAAAHVLAFRDNQVVLTFHKKRGWTIPGGHINHGETGLEAVKREAFEEAGLHFETVELVAVERIVTLPGQKHSSRYSNPSYQLFYFGIVESFLGTQENGMCSNAQFFTYDDAVAKSAWVRRHRKLFDTVFHTHTTM